MKCGLSLAALMFAAVATAGPGAPRLGRGDELRFVGEVVEAGERAGLRFRKSHDLEVRLIVLDSRPGGADCALLTKLHPRLDEVVAGPVEVAGGGNLERPPAAVRVELIRVDYRGRVYRLHPKPGQLPLATGAGVPATPFPPATIDGVPLSEVGVFVPIAPGDGPTWTVAEEGRPAANWATAGEAVWNGGRAWEVRRTQETPHFTDPARALTAWKRTDILVVSPADGVAGTLSRRVEHRHGKDVTAWTEVKLERRPAARPTGSRLGDARREAELAVSLSREFDALARFPARAADYAARLPQVERAARDVPPGDFREGIESVTRRWVAAAGGELPRVPAPEAEPIRLELGHPAPDFAITNATGQRETLTSCRGTPVAAIFYRPGAKTAPETLAVVDALRARYAARIRVWPLAVYDPPATGDGAAYDGAAAQAAFGVVNYPRFCLIDAGGELAWDFPGVGPEVGFLLDGRVVAALEAGSSAGTRVAEQSPGLPRR